MTKTVKCFDYNGTVKLKNHLIIEGSTMVMLLDRSSGFSCFSVELRVVLWQVTFQVVSCWIRISIPTTVSCLLISSIESTLPFDWNTELDPAKWESQLGVFGWNNL